MLALCLLPAASPKVVNLVMNKLRLYTTADCSLCEQFLDTLLQVNSGGLSLEVIDIVSSDKLLHQYAERIPVLTLGDAVYEGAADGIEHFLHTAVNR